MYGKLGDPLGISTHPPSAMIMHHHREGSGSHWGVFNSAERRVPLVSPTRPLNSVSVWAVGGIRSWIGWVYWIKNLEFREIRGRHAILKNPEPHVVGAFLIGRW